MISGLGAFIKHRVHRAWTSRRVNHAKVVGLSVEMEELSSGVVAPPVTGRGIEVIWPDKRSNPSLGKGSSA